jgi:hypothetical protein
MLYRWVPRHRNLRNLLFLSLWRYILV